METWNAMINSFLQSFAVMTASATALVLALSGFTPPGAPDPHNSTNQVGTAQIPPRLAAAAPADAGCTQGYPWAVPYPAGYEVYYEGIYMCQNELGDLAVRNLTKQVWVFEPSVSVYHVEPSVSQELFARTHGYAEMVLPKQTVVVSDREYITWAPDLVLTTAWMAHHVVAKRAKVIAQKKLTELLADPFGKTADAMVTCSVAVADSIRSQMPDGEPTDPEEALSTMRMVLTHTGNGAGCAAAVASMESDLRATSTRRTVIKWAKAAERATTAESNLQKVETVVDSVSTFCRHSSLHFRGLGC
jgi:hypothetical protein